MDEKMLSYLQRKRFKYSLFWNTTIVIDRVDSNPVLCPWSQSSYLEDRLIGTDINNHLMVLRIEDLLTSHHYRRSG